MGGHDNEACAARCVAQAFTCTLSKGAEIGTALVAKADAKAVAKAQALTSGLSKGAETGTPQATGFTTMAGIPKV